MRIFIYQGSVYAAFFRRAFLDLSMFRGLVLPVVLGVKIGEICEFGRAYLVGYLVAWEEGPQPLLAKVKNVSGRIGIFTLNFPHAAPKLYFIVRPRSLDVISRMHAPSNIVK